MTDIFIFLDISADNITAGATILLAIATFFLGVAAYKQYLKSTEIKRAEFLTTLYEKFYENDNLKVVREWIDPNENEPLKLKIDFDKKKTDDVKFEERFADYLNFFQFIVVLINFKQIKRNEIEQMFDYYLKLLKNTGFIMEYLSLNGYRELKSFLLNYKKDDK